MEIVCTKTTILSSELDELNESMRVVLVLRNIFCLSIATNVFHMLAINNARAAQLQANINPRHFLYILNYGDAFFLFLTDSPAAYTRSATKKSFSAQS